MSCGKPTCQSGGCSSYDDEQPLSPTKPPVTTNGRRQPPLNPNTCVKCKLNDAVAGGSGGGDDGRFCADCFRGSLFGKFRFSVTSTGMISPSDKVLVAFSAGTCSRVALQFVHEMQDKAQKNFEKSRDRSLPVFGVGVVYIDESSARRVPTAEADAAIQHIKAVVSDLAAPEKTLHIAPLESIYDLNPADGRERLRMLLETMSDNTGKEDFLTHLRMLCLQKVALDNGYTQLVLGSCTSTIARHVLSATVKGQGYSLPADMQYVDARWHVPVLLPLRDCLAQELNTLCQLDGLKTLATVNGPQSGINALVSSFVSLLQEENPSRECTIVRTAGKLTPFSFNRLPDVDDPKARLASQRRQKKFNIKSDEHTPPESFCPLCNSPLHASDSSSLGIISGEQQSAETFGATCCSSCRYQILPDDSLSMDQFYALLPQPIMSRAAISDASSNHALLREQIQDFLLSDSEDGS
ncbi:cytoplasmic tRNA 2-thiolation protein 2-like [Chenopodium quinoa]|uniref:cytoplasmic tRNA 2-thiolation protein 2-like n=1 Tax=Chenopodium quinoa TaxID=63459 RepID=UPI000B7959B3|nr:cytoplasmic tRNA 2-thiolation protein 2-like [Chenopodium quinoa]